MAGGLGEAYADFRLGFPLGFAGVEVGGGVEAILLPVVSEDAGQAPDQRAGGEAHGNDQKGPAVKAHEDFLSRAFQVRTARAISRRKRTATAITKSRAIRTAGWLWIACQLADQDWWSQRTKTVRRKTGEM